MKIELLVFDGCPNREPTEKLIRETVSELGGDVKIEVVTIADHYDAVARSFLGSPSCRVNGNDVELDDTVTTPFYMRFLL